MLSCWIREGNFYHNIKQLVYGGVNHVNFKNFAPYTPLIKQITLEGSDINNAQLKLYPDFCRRNELKTTTEKFFINTKIDNQTCLFTDLKTKELDLSELLNLFDYINHKDKRKEYPEELNRELIQLLDYLRTKKTYAHLIKENEPDFRLNKKKHGELYWHLNRYKYVIDDEEKENLSRTIKSLLANGDDPNETDFFSGKKLLTLAMETGNTELIELFLAYGSDCYLHPAEFSESPIEIATLFGKHEAIKLFNNFNQREQRPHSASDKLLETTLLSSKDKVITHLIFANEQVITSTLIAVKDLSERERDELYQLYAQIFDTAAHKESKKIFEQTFSNAQGNIVDLLRNKNNQVIGASLYKLKKIKDEIWVLIDLELLAPDYRQFGIMPLITYRLPFSLQFLFPNDKIWIVFFAAHYSSYQRIENLLGIPKFQPLKGKLMDEAMQNLQNLFNYKFALHYKEGAYCYLLEEAPTVVKGPAQSQFPKTMEKFYQNFRRITAKDEPDEIKKRDVPVIIPTGHELLLKLIEICAKRNIGFFRNAKYLADTLSQSELIDHSLSAFDHSLAKQYKVYNSKALFWKNEKKEYPLESNDLSENAGFSVSSKL